MINFFVVLVGGNLMPLSPPASERDYSFNLQESEGISDLFDVPVETR